MKSIIFYTMIVILFSACSFKTPKNEWKIKSINAIDSYSKNFLKSNDKLARSDLKRAIRHAKKSADLNTLGRIYLSECALNISVGIYDNCSKYTNIEDIINNKNDIAYKNFILKKLSKSQINLLPNVYISFANSLITKNYKQANINIRDMKQIKSKLIAAKILDTNIDIKTIRDLIKSSSYYGYKKAVIYWLKKLRDSKINNIEKQNIIKKILILNSNS